MKIVIVGAGEVGFHIARQLSLEEKDVVLVDDSPEALRRVEDHLDVQTILGSGSNPNVLREAGIRGADILLAVTDRDETNLVACMAADLLAPHTTKIARIRDESYDEFAVPLREKPPHIQTIINPETEVVHTILELMSVPGAVDVGSFEGGRIKLVGIAIDTRSPLAGMRLAELPGMSGPVRPLIAALVRDNRLIVPRGKDRLRPGDLAYFISEEERLFDNLAFFGKRESPIRRVLIVGGGRIGFRLAARLEDQGIATKVIEKNADRCALLAGKLRRTVVLCGDGSDQDLLQEENVRDMDLIVTVTQDEETNILTALLASRLGVDKAICKIDKFSYFPLMKAIGIEQVVSPRLSAINSILQHIRKGKVLSAMAIQGEQAEVLEAVALETSDIVGRPLRSIDFPKGAMVAAVIRDGRIILPTGESVVEPGDRVILFALREAVPRIERLLAVKLEYF